jgi:uncharacterized protein (UPF0548 family)
MMRNMWFGNPRSYRSRRVDLDDKFHSYANVGCTAPDETSWFPPKGLRTFERTVLVGSGDDDWERVCSEIMQWCVKTRSGFGVETRDGSAQSVLAGKNFWLVARFGLVQVREPIRVVATVATATRCGYAYGTLDGHPVSGEEAFVVHRSERSIFFTVRSVTSHGKGTWRMAFPLVLVAQRWYRRLYLKALA